LVLEIDARHHDHAMRFAQPGTIAMLVAGPEGEEHLHRIEEAVRAEELDALDEAHAGIMRQFGRSLLEPRHDVRRLDAVPVFTSFRYGQKTLRRGMFSTSGLLVARSLALYDGAKLDPSQFQVVHHRARDAELRVQTLVVVRVPRLTDLERKMIEQIRADVAEVNLGEEVGMFTGAIIGEAARELGARAVEWVAHEIGIDQQLHDLQHAAEDVYHQAVNDAQEVVHQVAQELGVDGIINAAEDVAGLVTAVEGLADRAVDAAVDFIADAVGAAVDWVAHNIFTVDGANQADQQQADQQQADQQQADQQQAAQQQADQQQAAQQQADQQQADQQQADQQQADQQQADQQQAAQQQAGHDGAGGGFAQWREEIARVSQELEQLPATTAVRELLALRAQMIAVQSVGQRTSLIGH
jgi:hypothetical protein